MKGLEQVKEWGAFESKTLSKLDGPLGSSVTSGSSVFVPKVNQKLTPRGECAMTSSASNSNESKVSQSHGRPGSLLRSNCIIARKGAENHVTIVRSFEQKLSQDTSKDEPSSRLSWTEHPSNNPDENSQNGSSGSRESSCQSEKIRENTDISPKPTVTAGLKNLTCHKCRETGHTADLCAIVCPQASVISGSRVIKEEMSKGSRLKTAIGAANLKKPGIFRKKKESDQPDGFPKKLTIPEHKFTWQGAFEIRRGGKVFDSYGGVQAHLSTCASPKVLEVVNQFRHKISLVEVPCLSTWPRQFHDNGPKEYNVALYFFAKDLDSYEKVTRTCLKT